jgi:hypothetical protein
VVPGHGDRQQSRWPVCRRDRSQQSAKHAGQFLYLFWWGAISGAVLLVLTPFVRKMMAGVK